MRLYTQWTDSLIRRWIHYSTRSIPQTDTHRVFYWINRTIWLWGRRTNFFEHVIQRLAELDPTYEWVMFLLHHRRCQVPDAALRILTEVSYTPVPRLIPCHYRADCTTRLIERIKHEVPIEHKDTLTYSDLYPVFQRVVHLAPSGAVRLDDIDTILVTRLSLETQPVPCTEDSLLLQLPLCMAHLASDYDTEGDDDVDRNA